MFIFFKKFHTYNMSSSSKYLSKETINSNYLLVKKKRILEGRRVNHHSLLEFNIFGLMYTVGCQFLINLKDGVYPKHIKNFYAGFHFHEPSNSITLSMYGQHWMWDIKIFFELLHVPCQGKCVFSNSETLEDFGEVTTSEIVALICKSNTCQTTTCITTNDLTSECLVLYKILAHNLFMRGNNHKQVRAMDAYVLYCIKANESLNFGYIIAKTMSNIPNRNDALPYGLLLTELFNALSLPNARRYVAAHAPLSKITLFREVNFLTFYRDISYTNAYAYEHMCNFEDDNSFYLVELEGTKEDDTTGNQRPVVII